MNSEISLAYKCIIQFLHLDINIEHEPNKELYYGYDM